MPLHPNSAELPPPRSFATRALLILWPAFVMAGVLEALVFVVVDPDGLHWFGGEALSWSRSAVYSVTFLIIWGVIATSGAITQLLDEPAHPSRH
ncbi:MAG: hypothetical protein HY021_14815 [Burkholderiales bacterium]|nr:hypothetical protein [Burkholderiales bacterium]